MSFTLDALRGAAAGSDEIAGVTYMVKRFYADLRVGSDVVETGLSFQEARDYCDNPETSWKTCTSPEGEERTRKFGPWFCGFDQE